MQPEVQAPSSWNDVELTSCQSKTLGLCFETARPASLLYIDTVYSDQIHPQPSLTELRGDSEIYSAQAHTRLSYKSYLLHPLTSFFFFHHTSSSELLSCALFNHW